MQFVQPNTKACSLCCVYFWHIRWCWQHQRWTGVFCGMKTWHRFMIPVCSWPLHWRPLLPTVGGCLCGPWHDQKLKIEKENKQAAAMVCFLPLIDKHTHTQIKRSTHQTLSHPHAQAHLSTVSRHAYKVSGLTFLQPHIEPSKNLS